MCKTIYLPLLLTLTLLSCEQTVQYEHTTTMDTISFTPITVKYPAIYKDSSVVDDYHDMLVADPYRWLEDENADATRSWITSQNQVTEEYLAQIPYREAIKFRLEQIWNYERYSPPSKEGDHYYFFKNDGLQNQPVLYRQQDFATDPELVLDPNKLSEEGTAALGNYAFSKDGTKLVYLVSEGGSDWHTGYVMDLTNRSLLPDKIEWIKFSELSWYKNGFFYSRYPAPKAGSALTGQNKFHQVFYHQVGTPQSEDILVFADRSNPRKGFYASVTDDERFLSIRIWESSSGNALYVKNLQQSDGEFIPVVDNNQHDFNVIDNNGDKLYVLTNYNAPNYRLITIHAQQPAEDYWEELIPESEDVLQSVDVIGGKLIATYIHNASSKVVIYNLEGKKGKSIELPEIGTVEDFTGKHTAKQAFYSFTSFTQPSSVYLLNMDDLSSIPWKPSKTAFKSRLYTTEQVWYESFDGTKVPMFITYKKGLKMDGQRPTLLYGYGGFNVPILPQFNTTRLNLAPIFLENGGIFAVANIRGGGEFGRKWHHAGTKDQKQNVFNDFIAAAEYLIANQYTSKDKLAAYGRSNGGLLIGACMTQRPDLFQVALPAVGVLDMLRYQEFTIGRAWAVDYGLSEVPTEFDFLYAYSPLHNIEEARYPATLVTTADHDDRVVPAHSFKFLSTLQEYQQGDNPTLIRVNTSAGHGTGKPTRMKIEEAADILSFTFYSLKNNIRYTENVLQ